MNENFIYINYISKLRITNNPELERRTNYGRIITKRILKADLRPDRGDWFQNKGLCKLINLTTHCERDKIGYDVFQIPKRSSNEMRTIYAPNEYTLNIQHAILKSLQKAQLLPTNNAYGFVQDRNCKTALMKHQKHNSRWFLKMDIRKFFDNTSYDMVMRAFRYTYPLCILPSSTLLKLAKIVTFDDFTPQGAATSPMICNIVLTPFDYAFQKYCHKHGLIYTRYADDILVSSEVSFDWKEVQDIVIEYLKMLGYTINVDKTRYGSYAGRNWNLGLMYNRNSDITIGHRSHHVLKCRVHNYIKAEEKTADEYYKLIGWLGYWKYIEEDNELPQKLLAELKQHKPTGGITDDTVSNDGVHSNGTDNSNQLMVEEEEVLPF